jgi:hypothetical protein
VGVFVLAPSLERGSAATPENPSGGLPLGEPDLQETRAIEEVAPGVTYTKILRGEQSESDFYTVDVAFRTDLPAAESVAAW